MKCAFVIGGTLRQTGAGATRYRADFQYTAPVRDPEEATVLIQWRQWWGGWGGGRSGLGGAHLHEVGTRGMYTYKYENGRLRLRWWRLLFSTSRIFCILSLRNVIYSVYGTVPGRQSALTEPYVCRYIGPVLATWRGPKRRLKLIRKRRMNLATPQVSTEIVFYTDCLCECPVSFVWCMVLLHVILFFSHVSVGFEEIYTFRHVIKKFGCNCHSVRKFLMQRVICYFLFISNKHNVPTRDV